MIEVKGLRKKFGSKEALRGVSFDIDKGEIVGFLGPNAAGKTTMMRILTSFIPPTSGTVKVDGLDIFEDSLAIRKKLGYMPENVALYHEMKVIEYLKFIAKIEKVSKNKMPYELRSIIKKCGLEKVTGQLIGTLSKGYKQRVGLAQALIGDPEILILDEPTIGLDPKQITEIRNLIKELGKDKTVILSSHILPEVEMTCNRVIIINEGKIVASGSPESLTSGIQGGEALEVVVRGDKEEILAKLKAVEGVKNIRDSVAEAKDAHKFELESKEGIDLRSNVSKVIIEGGFELLEIKKEKMDLEDIFIKLITKEGS